MTTSEDIRANNRLERNAKRLQKAIELIRLVRSEDDLGGLELWLIEDKMKDAKQVIEKFKKETFR